MKTILLSPIIALSMVAFIVRSYNTNKLINNEKKLKKAQYIKHKTKTSVVGAQIPACQFMAFE